MSFSGHVGRTGIAMARSAKGSPRSCFRDPPSAVEISGRQTLRRCIGHGPRDTSGDLDSFSNKSGEVTQGLRNIRE